MSKIRESKILEWVMMMQNDPISKNKDEFYKFLKISNDTYLKYCPETLQELFKELGLVYHPDLIKMFYEIGKSEVSDEQK